MPVAERMLPRSARDRFSLGFLSLFYGVPFGFMAVGLILAPMPRFGILFTIALAVTEEFLLTITTACILCFVWAVAMPTWVERLFRAVWKKLFILILLALVPIILLVCLGALGIRLNEGLDP